MPDATYKDTVTAQIEGNPFIDYEIKESILNIMKKSRFNESDYQDMTKEDKNRFFYKNKFSNVADKIKDTMPVGIRKRYQAEANAAARAGTKHKDKFVAEAFGTTYKKGGHKYIDGKRQY